MSDENSIRTEYGNKDPLLVSVIVPVYNVAPFLAEALKSVTDQTYRNLEIIVVDDGSTDGSSLICDDHAAKDSRIIVIHQNNKGLSGARNTGLNAMTGDIVAFLDSDDIMHPEMIERMVCALQKDGSDVTVCRFITFSETKDIETISRTRQGDGTSLPEGVLNRKDALCGFADGKISHTVWNKAYRSSLWENVRFPEGHVYEDTFTTFSILNISSRTSILSDILYYYRARKGSITRFNSVDNIRDFLLSRRNLLEAVESSIPEVFTSEQLEALKRSSLSSAIFKYAGLPSGAAKQTKKEISALREEIMEFGNTTDIDGSGTVLRTAWKMLCRCPGALRAAYPAVRKLIDISRSLKKQR